MRAPWTSMDDARPSGASGCSRPSAVSQKRGRGNAHPCPLDEPFPGTPCDAGFRQVRVPRPIPASGSGRHCQRYMSCGKWVYHAGSSPTYDGCPATLPKQGSVRGVRGPHSHGWRGSVAGGSCQADLLVPGCSLHRSVRIEVKGLVGQRTVAVSVRGMPPQRWALRLALGGLRCSAGNRMVHATIETGHRFSSKSRPQRRRDWS